TERQRRSEVRHVRLDKLELRREHPLDRRPGAPARPDRAPVEGMAFPPVLKRERSSRREVTEELVFVESSIAADERVQAARVVHEVERRLWSVAEEVRGDELDLGSPLLGERSGHGDRFGKD